MFLDVVPGSPEGRVVMADSYWLGVRALGAGYDPVIAAGLPEHVSELAEKRVNHPSGSVKANCTHPNSASLGPVGNTASWIQRRKEAGAGWGVMGVAALETSAGEHLVGFLSPATPRGSRCPWLVPGAQEGRRLRMLIQLSLGWCFSRR